jgi:hypothetical protein
MLFPNAQYAISAGRCRYSSDRGDMLRPAVPRVIGQTKLARLVMRRGRGRLGQRAMPMTGGSIEPHTLFNASEPKRPAEPQGGEAALASLKLDLSSARNKRPGRQT